MEAVVLHRVAFLEYFCRIQGRDFKPLAAPIYPNMGQVIPPPPRLGLVFIDLARVVQKVNSSITRLITIQRIA